MSLQPHPYKATPDTPVGICACGLPRRNRHHVDDVTTTAPAAPHPAFAGQVHQAEQDAAAAKARDGYNRVCRDGSGALRSVFDVLLACPEGEGFTDQELAAHHALRWWGENTVRPRRIDLVYYGLAEEAADPDGKALTRATSSGGRAKVWTLTAAARAIIAARPQAVSA